jgi:predicted ATP pyrophosphatase (TIGR00289 family)
MNTPLILKKTKGEKESELKELKEALQEAKEKYMIEGVVTGAVASQYQASRIQKICHELDLWCFNPLWQIDQLELLRELVDNNFDVRIIGVYGYPLDKTFLGRKLNDELIKELKLLKDEFKINPAGEGGETESLVVDCPLFKKSIKIEEEEKDWENYSGKLSVKKASLVDKKNKEYTKPTNKYKNKTKKDCDYEEDVLIISTVTKELPILNYEFIRPIVDLIKSLGKTYCLKHISEMNENLSEQFKDKKIIISGTALKDNNFVRYKEKINLLRNAEVIGICAGAELIGLEAGGELKEFLEIGQKEIEEVETNPLFSKTKQEEFFLHQFGFDKNDKALTTILSTKNCSAGFTIPERKWIGIQFHPELREKNLLIEFLK